MPHINEDWLELGTFITAVVFVVLTILAMWLKAKRRNQKPKFDTTVIGLSAVTGVTLLPCFLMIMAPVFPAIPKLVSGANTSLLSCSFFVTLIVLLSDWWKRL